MQDGLQGVTRLAEGDDDGDVRILGGHKAACAEAGCPAAWPAGPG